MFDYSAIADIRKDLQSHGYVTLADLSGRALHLINTGLFGGDGRGLLLAYEGWGAFTFDAQRPLNAFRLVSAGFPLTQAGVIADLVNQILHPAPQQVANKVAMLHITGPPEPVDNVPGAMRPLPTNGVGLSDKPRKPLDKPRFKTKAKPSRARGSKPPQHRKT